MFWYNARRITPEHEGRATISFGEQLRHYRERAGLTQEELAAQAGLTAKAISALERAARHAPYPQTVLALAERVSTGD